MTMEEMGNMIVVRKTHGLSMILYIVVHICNYIRPNLIKITGRVTLY